VSKEKEVNHERGNGSQGVSEVFHGNGIMVATGEMLKGGVMAEEAVKVIEADKVTVWMLGGNTYIV